MIGLSVAFLACITVAAATRSLMVKASVPEAVLDIDHLNVLTTITNTGDEPLRLLNDPRSPLSQITTNKFVVTNSEGASPTFSGLRMTYLPHVVARRSGDDSRLTVLGPGAFVEVSHEVFRYYNFTASGPGFYTFTPLNVFHVLGDDGSLSVLKAVTVSATVDISGKLANSKNLGLRFIENRSPAKNRGFQKRAAFVGCSSAQSDIVQASIDAATALCVESVEFLNNNPGGSDLETSWFGEWTEERHHQVLVTFQRLEATILEWTYDCARCTDDNSMAIVNANEYGKVFLCPGYWDTNYPDEERWMSIIHEGTHFPEILGSEDYEYGEDDCKILAVEDPDDAIDNADNYAYFAKHVDDMPPGEGGKHF